MYIGGAPWFNGSAGTYFDNIQVFDKALKLKDIEELALTNEEAVSSSKIASTIHFHYNLVVAVDYE